MTTQEDRDRVLGYMTGLGCVHCVKCSIGPDEGGHTKPVHPTWEPVRAHNLANDGDRCDGCRELLLAPTCDQHGPMVKRAADRQSPEVSWCGTWWDCQSPRCGSSHLEPSEALRAQLAGPEIESERVAKAARIAAHTRRASREAAHIRTAIEGRDAAIVALAGEGVSLRKIAAAAGLRSAEGVREILRRRAMTAGADPGASAGDPPTDPTTATPIRPYDSIRGHLPLEER